MRRKKTPYTRFLFQFPGGVCRIRKTEIHARLAGRQYRRDVRISLEPNEWFVLGLLLRKPGTIVPTEKFRWYLKRTGSGDNRFAPYHLLAKVKGKLTSATQATVSVQSKRQNGDGQKVPGYRILIPE